MRVAVAAAAALRAAAVIERMTKSMGDWGAKRDGARGPTSSTGELLDLEGPVGGRERAANGQYVRVDGQEFNSIPFDTAFAFNFDFA